MPELRKISLEAIRSTPLNPRASQDKPDDPEGVQGLAASLGDEENPQLVEPPVVEEITPGEYRILAGERRIRAARLAGWGRIDCLVHQPLDPAQAHTLRLVENLHRQELHPLDKAAALKIAWYTANADELGLKAQARQILGIEQAPTETLARLDELLKSAGFAPNRPAVVWDTVLEQLGLGMTRLQRARLLRVLGIENQVQAQVRELEISEASLRSLGTLEAEDQVRLVDEVAQDPSLARRVRRIARVVQSGAYSMEEALAEARGQVYLDEAPDSGVPHGGAPLSDGDEDMGASAGIPHAHEALLESDVSEVVLELLEAANQVSVALNALAEAIGEGRLADLPQPWDEYAREALDLMRSEIEKLGGK